MRLPAAILLVLLKYILYTPASLALILLTWLLAPGLALTSFFTADGNLPRALYYFQTDDASLDQGTLQFYSQPPSRLKVWWNRMRWLVRNPAYGFARNVFGFKKPARALYYRNFAVLHPGKIAEFVLKENPSANLWHRYVFYFKVWWPWSDRYVLKVHLGWKVADKQPRMMIATLINPFKRNGPPSKR